MSPGTPEQKLEVPEAKPEPHKHFDERMQLGIADMPSYRGELKPLAMPDSKGQ
jgi:hypothetical protein